MSRQVNIPAILLLLTTAVSTAVAQDYGQMGMLSGSGQAFMPSTFSSPEAQFRLQLGRIALTGHGGRGLNLAIISAGFSSSLEGYVKYTSEQVGALQSVSAMGVGAKFTVPYLFPLVRVVSLWGESSSMVNEDRSQLYEPKLDRGALIITPLSGVIRVSLLIGLTRDADGNAAPMEGAGLLAASGHAMQWGIEYLHGYNGAGTHYVDGSVVLRPFPYVSLNLGPGYVVAPHISGWMVLAGISMGTADIDFTPAAKPRRPAYKLPTIEELEKGTTDTHEKPNGEEHHE